MIDLREQIAIQFYKNSQISRNEIFGNADYKYMPANYQEDASTMFAGFAGKNYKKNGVVLFGVNPGGGGDGYKKHPRDDELYSQLKIFKNCNKKSSLIEFEKINVIFLPILKEWNLWNILLPTLEALNINENDIVYLNAIPYRTRENKKPPVYAQNISWSKIMQPTLNILKPKLIVCLGKKVGEIINRFNKNSEWNLIIIPRTNGDRYISEEAKKILQELQNEYGT